MCDVAAGQLCAFFGGAAVSFGRSLSVVCVCLARARYVTLHVVLLLGSDREEFPEDHALFIVVSSHDCNFYLWLFFPDIP